MKSEVGEVMKNWRPGKRVPTRPSLNDKVPVIMNKIQAKQKRE